MVRFPDEVVELLARAREIDVETVGRHTGRERRATVWVIVDDGTPYVRSEFGDAGNWYRNAVANPRVAIHVRGRRLAAQATRVADPQTQRLVSEAFRAKYGPSPSLDVMVRAEIEPMTIALGPTSDS